MNKRILALVATTLFCSVAVAEMKKGTPESAPVDPPATSGPSQGSNASMSTPSMKAAGKDAYAKLDVDNDGAISKKEAAGDAALAKTFDQSDENKDGKIDAAEFARSAAKGSPAASTPVTRP
jgi:hypothetical protein